MALSEMSSSHHRGRRLLLAMLVALALAPFRPHPADAVATECDSRPESEVPADAFIPGRFLADVDGDRAKDVITGYEVGGPRPDFESIDAYLHVELASGWGTAFQLDSLPDFSTNPVAEPMRVVEMAGRRLIVVGLEVGANNMYFAFFELVDCELHPVSLTSGGLPQIWSGGGLTHREWFTCRSDRIEMVEMYAANEDEVDLFPDIYPSGRVSVFRLEGSGFRPAGTVDPDLPRASREVRADFPDCSTFGGTFVDDDGSVFQGSIEWMAFEGLTQGCNPPRNDRFCPQDRLTRGEMAAFLVRAMGYSDDGGGDLFVDDDDSVFEGAIDRLGAAGVTRGCNPPGNDRFCPERRVTRGEMAAFLVRALGLTDDGGGDLFTDDDGHLFESSINRLGAAGITAGCNPPANDRFCPDDYVTRGQMAAFLRRALG